MLLIPPSITSWNSSRNIPVFYTSNSSCSCHSQKQSFFRHKGWEPTWLTQSLIFTHVDMSTIFAPNTSPVPTLGGAPETVLIFHIQFSIHAYEHHHPLWKRCYNLLAIWNLPSSHHYKNQSWQHQWSYNIHSSGQLLPVYWIHGPVTSWPHWCIIALNIKSHTLF